MELLFKNPKSVSDFVAEFQKDNTILNKYLTGKPKIDFPPFIINFLKKSKWGKPERQGPKGPGGFRQGGFNPKYANQGMYNPQMMQQMAMMMGYMQPQGMPPQAMPGYPMNQPMFPPGPMGPGFPGNFKPDPNAPLMGVNPQQNLNIQNAMFNQPGSFNTKGDGNPTNSNQQRAPGFASIEDIKAKKKEFDAMQAGDRRAVYDRLIREKMREIPDTVQQWVH